jgi:hypothetical protein
MLEQKIEKLTEAVVALTAAIEKGGLGGGAATSTTKASTAKASTTKASKPKHTADKVKAKILEVKEKHGMDRAKEIISEAGGDDLANLLSQPDKFDNAYALAEAALEEDAAGEDDGDGL